MNEWVEATAMENHTNEYVYRKQDPHLTKNINENNIPSHGYLHRMDDMSDTTEKKYLKYCKCVNNISETLKNQKRCFTEKEKNI